MCGNQAVIQQANIVKQFRRRHTVALLHLFDFHVALREMRHHAHAKPAPLAIHVTQEIA